MAQQTCNTLRGNTASIMMEIKFVRKIDLVKKKLNDEKVRVYNMWADELASRL